MPGLLSPSPLLASLLSAAHAEEDEDTSRLVLADYLEEQGDPRAEMVRLSCAHDRLPLGDPDQCVLSAQLQHWESRHLADFLGKQQLIEIFFQRGLATLEMSAAMLLSPALSHKVRSALEQGWVWQLEIKQMADQTLQSILALGRTGRASALVLSYCSDLGLLSLLQLAHLRDLKLTSVERVTDAGVAHLVRLPELRSLDLTYWYGTGSGLARLAGLPLRRLRFFLCPGLTDAGVAQLEAFACLEQLELHSCVAVTKAVLPHLVRVASLQDLWLDSLLDGPGLASLATLPRLRKLTLNWIRELNTSWDHRLGDFQGLEMLEVFKCPLSEEGLAVLARLPRLQSLHLPACPGVMDRGLRHLARLESLRDLRLNYCPEPTTYGLGPLDQLERLEVSNCPGLPGAGLGQLAGLQRLRNLDMSRNEWLGDNALKQLTCLPQLERVNLAGCKALTDAGVAHLTGLSRLKCLSLARCERLTDAGLACLRSLKQLRWLEVIGCPLLTQTGIDRLRQELPECLIRAPDSQ